MRQLPQLSVFALLAVLPAQSDAQDCVFPARHQLQGLELQPRIQPRAHEEHGGQNGGGHGGNGHDPGHGGKLQRGRLQAGPLALTTTTGTLKNLVLLLRFSDHGPGGQDRTLPSVADVSTMMNAIGGDPLLAPTGSVRDFYLENSYGQLTIESTVVGWLALPETEAYYADGVSGLSEFMELLVAEALALADPLVDFAEFDDDGDGWIDAITLLHSGYGAEWIASDMYGTPYTSRIWSHKSTVATWTSTEGVQVSDYHISPGLWDIVGSDIGRIGVIAHELGHFLGLPDLYDADGGGFGVGMWGLMGLGSWGFDWEQLNPSHLCAWSKMKLGWIEPQKILPGTYTALEIETNPSLFMIDSGYRPGEYLLIENRQPTGFEASMPQGGLAIWHIDEGKGSLNYNDVNWDEGFPGMVGWPENNLHYRIALLQADGAFDLEGGDNPGDEFDLFNAGLVAEIDATTTPNTNAYQSGVVIENMNRVEGIGPSAASITFTYVNSDAPMVTSTSLPNANLGSPYAASLSGTGGMTPFTWSELIPDPSYTQVDLGPQPFTMGGVPYSYNADEQTWAHTLPFVFPFFGRGQRRVYLTPNGSVDLAPLYDEAMNSHNYLRFFPRIAGLWDNLRTYGAAGTDIYITTQPDQVRFRWEALTSSGSFPANVAITLHADGRIRFDYGIGNTGLSPNVGISRGYAGDMLLVDTHDTEEALTLANSIEFVLEGSQLPPGLSISPSGVVNGGPTATGLYEFDVRVQDNKYRYDIGPVSLLVEPPSLTPIAVSPKRPTLGGSFSTF